MLSPAETITYYFVADTSTARTDDYVLMRQVNNNAAERGRPQPAGLPGAPLLRVAPDRHGRATSSR